jgi:hypothetical protein
VDVELTETGAGGRDTTVSAESEGVEGVEVREFDPYVNDVLVILVEGLAGEGMFRGVGEGGTEVVRIEVFVEGKGRSKS